jgi:hypothetical protein
VRRSLNRTLLEQDGTVSTTLWVPLVVAAISLLGTIVGTVAGC